MGDVLWTGSRVGGYEIVRLLGQGGMGAVYEARDPAGRSVALKVILGGVLLLDADRRRFEREARAAAAISHPNVTRVHAAGDDRGRPYVVFELVPGGSLGQRIKERGRLPWPEAVAHAVGIARGLEAIHAAGFVHRDLKPDNVLLDEHGTPKVSDLGLVRRTGGASIALTATGELLGTPSYMAPEQVDHAKTVDARADVYALGATLFALVTGEPPFAGVGPKVLYAVIQTPPPRLSQRAPDVPPALERLVLECLAKDPNGRPASAGIVAGRLEAIARSGGRLGKSTARVAWPLGALVVAGAVVAGAVGAGVLARAPSRPVATPTPAGPSPSPSPTARDLLSHGQRALPADPESAVRFASSAIELDPSSGEACELRATAQEVLWRPREAIADATRAHVLAKTPGAKSRALAILAAAHADARDYDAAKRAAHDALVLVPNNALALAVLGEAEHWLRWDSLVRDAACKTALDYADRALAQDRESPRANLTRGVALWHKGDPADNSEVAACANVVTTKLPRSPWGWLLRALSTDDDAESLRSFHEAVARAPDNAVMQGELGGTTFHRFRRLDPDWRDHAFAAVSSATMLVRPPPAAFAFRAAIEKEWWDERHDPRLLEAAIADSSHAMEVDPAPALAAHVRGMCSVAQKDFSRAIADLTIACRHADAWGNATADLAQALLDNGQRQDAYDELNAFFHEPDGRTNKTRAEVSKDSERPAALFIQLGGKP